MMKYIRFIFENAEPLKIADDSISQSSQVSTLSYVPGSALRGAVIHAFVKSGELDAYKTVLLSDDVSFLNAYVTADGKEFIPSLKGFYEDKTDAGTEGKKIENQLTGGVITPGYKRAALGKYCYPDGDTFCYTSIPLGSDMKINKGKRGDKRNVLRNQYIEPGCRFIAYIAVSEAVSEKLCKKIVEMLEQLRSENALVLGGSRSFGYGKCIIQGDVEEGVPMPYSAYALTGDAEDSVYMAFLSDTAMINDRGEPVGIDRGLLAEKLGVDSLAIETCATSVADVRGYNRTWQTWVPSAKMYEKGSVFRLRFKGETVTADTLHKIMDEGIGIRTNEGCGRVLFLREFENIGKKREVPLTAIPKDLDETMPILTPEEEQTMRIAAKGFYLTFIDRAQEEYLAKKGTKEKKKLADYRMNGSQRGAMEAILHKNLYTEDGGFDELLLYLEHAKQKDERQNVQKVQRRRGDAAEYIRRMRDAALPELFDGLPEKVMGLDAGEILTGKEIRQIKERLVIAEIKRCNRGGRGDE